MPSAPRRAIVDPNQVAVYHCWNRTVRHTFLCGDDSLTGNNYEYRREWIHQIEQTLAGLFAIEVGFHATLSNHLHLVLRSCPDVAATWSDEEIARRWLTITKIKRNGALNVAPPTDAEINAELGKDELRAKKLRCRLSDVSWLMGTLCEHVSRRINREEGVTGTCWEGRYDVKLLVDEASILVCGIYVDLNWIRAGMATTPEESRYTSAYDRIQAYQQTDGSNKEAVASADTWLCKLTLDETRPINAPEHYSSTTSQRASDKGILSVSLQEYLGLLECTGLRWVEGKRGKIPDGLLPILERLNIETGKWFDAVEQFDNWFGRVVGGMTEVAKVAKRAEQNWFRGQSRCAQVFAS